MNIFSLKPDFCFFDWDNTIVNTDKISHVAFSAVCNEMQIDHCFTLEQVVQVNGLDFNRFFKDFFKEQAEKAISIYRRVYNENSHNLSVFEDMFILLKKIKNLDIKMAIISNKPYDILKEEVVRLKVAEYMADFTGSGLTDKEKPDKSLFDLVCKRLKINDPKQKNIWFFGDSPIDIQFSKNSNMNATIFLGLKKNIKHTIEDMNLNEDKSILFTEGSIKKAIEIFNKFN